MSFQKDCHSKNLSLHETSNVEDNNIPLFKIKRRSRSHENLTFKDSKKKVSNVSAQNQDGKVLKENKCNKSNTNSKVRYCAPTTVCEESFYVRCSKFEQKYKKPMAWFGTVATAEFNYLS
ncbi:unnamed protein product [Trifolium pratense]|uniref:Uncharacterized protein n=1 Tax=Trifolium pratense TaxID=57577 RepID=A0ACB0LNR0_TRIPR|nr:unnamed protein product [Trifolium pratense]